MDKSEKDALVDLASGYARKGEIGRAMGVLSLANHIRRNHTPLSEYDSSKFSPGDAGYRPYCLDCSTMKRMEHCQSGYRCSECGAAVLARASSLPASEIE